EVHLELERVKLPPLVRKCCKLFRQEAEARGIEFSVAVPKRLPEVFADENGVARVLNNLISNALKFTPDGGAVQISVEPASATPDGARTLAVLVSDTGIGIPLKDQPKVFERFTQVAGRLSEKPPGTGLGLAICREIVEKSNGEIWVQSAPDEGSTFGFTLPLAPAA
ncbi:MAG: sensor histidine kinase, partial [Planctomycetota bacterium]